MPRLLTLIPQRLARRRSQVIANAQDIARLIERETKAELGRDYPPASKPGQAPARRTGNLQSRQYARANVRWPTIEIEIGNTASYAQDLIERRRQWQRPVIARLRPQIEAIEKKGMPFGGSE